MRDSTETANGAKGKSNHRDPLNPNHEVMSISTVPASISSRELHQVKIVPLDNKASGNFVAIPTCRRDLTAVLNI